MISILLVGFRASPWQLSQVWRFGSEVQLAMILSESDEYSFWVCLVVSSPPMLCTVCVSMANTMPLYPYPLPPCLFPLLFPFLFSFLFLLDSVFLCFTRLTSPFCVVRGAAFLSCLYHYSTSTEKRITRFLSEGCLTILCQGEWWVESKGIASSCSPEYSMFSAYRNLPDVLAAKH